MYVYSNNNDTSTHRLAELTRQELLRRHKGRVANAVIHVAPLGATGLGEKYPLWASTLLYFLLLFTALCIELVTELEKLRKLLQHLRKLLIPSYIQETMTSS